MNSINLYSRLKEIMNSQSFCTLHEGPSHIVNIINSLYNNKAISILEIGCGEGVNLRELYESGFRNISAIDKNYEKIIVARDKVPDFHIQYVDIRDFCFEKNFDVIFHSMVGIFLNPNERKRVTKEIYKHFKKGGIYFFEELFKEKDNNRDKKIYLYTLREIQELSKLFGRVIYKPAYRIVEGKKVGGGILFAGIKD